MHLRGILAYFFYVNWYLCCLLFLCYKIVLVLKLGALEILIFLGLVFCDI
jgi:hypothetical protein